MAAVPRLIRLSSANADPKFTFWATTAKAAGLRKLPIWLTRLQMPRNVPRPLVERLLAARIAAAQHVQAHSGHDCRQPAAEVLDLAGVGPAEPKPGLLHGIVGFGGRAQHAKGNRPQVATVVLELLRQLVAIHQ